MSALASVASCKPRAIESGECLVSASVKRSHFPFAALAPLQAALHLPFQPGGNSSAMSTRTVGAPSFRIVCERVGAQKLSAMARVPSVEWSSTTRSEEHTSELQSLRHL